MYPARLAKFTVKRGAANKLSIRLEIAGGGGRERGMTPREGSKTLREITRARAANDARYKRSVTR